MIIAKTGLKPFVSRHRVAFAFLAALVALTIYVSFGRSGPHTRLVQFILLLAWGLYLTIVLRGGWRSLA